MPKIKPLQRNKKIISNKEAIEELEKYKPKEDKPENLETNSQSEESEDKALKKLETKKAEINKQILEKTIEVAKEKGLVVGSIDDLVCEEHPGAKFELTKLDSGFGFNRIKVYECKECKDKKLYPKTKAYECPICGIVLGEVLKIPYSSPREDWLSLAGREGKHYHCKICNTFLGSCYWKIS